MVPYRYGQSVAKYRVTPDGDLGKEWFQTAAASLSDSDAMYHAFASSLRQQELVMKFQVQLRTSEQSMPIEDAIVEWPQHESAYQTVARLILPRQNISAPLIQSINDVSFNVWRGTFGHRPMGGINRLRRQVYELSAAWRKSAEFNWERLSDVNSDRPS